MAYCGFCEDSLALLRSTNERLKIALKELHKYENMWCGVRKMETEIQDIIFEMEQRLK